MDREGKRKMRVRINPKPTPKQKEIIEEECRKEFYNLLGDYNKQVAVQILYILHFEYGWGMKRLERFSDLLADMQNQMVERYEMRDDDTPWLCRKKLEDDGIDVSKFLKENTNENLQKM